jgi:hypothetical protein
MNLTRTTITAGIAALSLAAAATPAVAKGGADPINNTVVSISPTAPAPFTGSGGSGGSGGGTGGSNRPATCTVVGVDPITGSSIATCTQNRV